AEELGRGERALAGELDLGELERAPARRDDETLRRFEQSARSRLRRFGDARAPDVELRAVREARDGARPGGHGAHEALALERGRRRVEVAMLLRELPAVRRARVALGRVAGGAGLDQLERLEHELARPLREPREQLARRLARADRRLAHEQEVAGVELLRHLL